jgi:hypothetical protein
MSDDVDSLHQWKHQRWEHARFQHLMIVDLVDMVLPGSSGGSDDQDDGAWVGVGGGESVT